MKLKYLVDTHILLWTFSNPTMISKGIRDVLEDEDAEIYYSPVSLWEISIKYSLGKLHISGMTPEEFYAELEDSFLERHTLNDKVVISSHALPRHHKDPFDRLLFWEAIQDDMVLLSVDNASDRYIKNGLKVIH
jgi:PIN domain nuclease of toxin-antitoxin system